MFEITAGSVPETIGPFPLRHEISRKVKGLDQKWAFSFRVGERNISNSTGLGGSRNHSNGDSSEIALQASILDHL